MREKDKSNSKKPGIFYVFLISWFVSSVFHYVYDYTKCDFIETKDGVYCVKRIK